MVIILIITYVLWICEIYTWECEFLIYQQCWFHLHMLLSLSNITMFITKDFLDTYSFWGNKFKFYNKIVAFFLCNCICLKKIIKYFEN